MRLVLVALHAIISGIRAAPARSSSIAGAAELDQLELRCVASPECPALPRIDTLAGDRTPGPPTGQASSYRRAVCGEKLSGRICAALPRPPPLEVQGTYSRRLHTARSLEQSHSLRGLQSELAVSHKQQRRCTVTQPA